MRHTARQVPRSNAIVAGVLLCLVLATFGVTRAGAQNAEDDPTQLEAGRAVFETNCAACHGGDGTGTQLGRSLVGVAAEQSDRTVHITSVTDGKGDMPPWRDKLSAEEIDAAVSFVRLTFVDEDLAATGVDTPLFAIGGLTLVGAGALFVHSSRSRRRS